MGQASLKNVIAMQLSWDKMKMIHQVMMRVYVIKIFHVNDHSVNLSETSFNKSCLEYILICQEGI